MEFISLIKFYQLSLESNYYLLRYRCEEMFIVIHKRITITVIIKQIKIFNF